jgi:hypothetical protein
VDVWKLGDGSTVLRLLEKGDEERGINLPAAPTFNFIAFRAVF